MPYCNKLTQHVLLVWGLYSYTDSLDTHTQINAHKTHTHTCSTPAA